jgi:SP family general alpha glucoside:H+ symporter-like MFS transporter
VVAIPAFRNDMGTLVGGNQVVPASWQSAWNGFTRLMQLFGGLSGGWLADRIGRKGAVACAAVLSTAMIFVQFFLQPQAFVQLLMGRGINGYAIGIFVSMSSTYTSEISPMPIRGLTTGGEQVVIEHESTH